MCQTIVPAVGLFVRGLLDISATNGRPVDPSSDLTIKSPGFFFGSTTGCSTTTFCEWSFCVFFFYRPSHALGVLRNFPHFLCVVRAWKGTTPTNRTKLSLDPATCIAKTLLQTIPVFLACTEAYWEWVPVHRRLGRVRVQRWRDV